MCLACSVCGVQCASWALYAFNDHCLVMKLCKGALTLSPPDFLFLVIASIVWSHQKLSQNRLHIVRRSAYLTVFLFTGFLANPVDITIVEFESQVDDIFCAWKRVDIRTSLSMFWVLFFSVQTSFFIFILMGIMSKEEGPHLRRVRCGGAHSRIYPCPVLMWE